MSGAISTWNAADEESFATQARQFEDRKAQRNRAINNAHEAMNAALGGVALSRATVEALLANATAVRAVLKPFANPDDPFVA